MSKEPKPKCIAPGCERKQYARGLCQSCRQISLRAINRGDVTESQLIAAGLLFEKKTIYQNASPMFLAIQAIKEPKQS